MWAAGDLVENLGHRKSYSSSQKYKKIISNLKKYMNRIQIQCVFKTLQDCTFHGLLVCDIASTHYEDIVIIYHRLSPASNHVICFHITNTWTLQLPLVKSCFMMSGTTELQNRFLMISNFIKFLVSKKEKIECITILASVFLRAYNFPPFSFPF